MKTDHSVHEEVQYAYTQLSRYAEDLKKTVYQLKESQNELERAYIDTVHRLARAVEYKDVDTGNHVSRISYYSALIAKKSGLDDATAIKIFHAAPMHDVGKISIPDAILLKPAKLTEAEFEIMKGHTTAGAALMAHSSSAILETARVIALTHHEKWDGSGYPNGLSGEDIPIEGRIVCLADVFDALMSPRPYKPAFSLEKATRIIKEMKGNHFDPYLTDIFFNNLDKILSIQDALCDANEAPCSPVSYTTPNNPLLKEILNTTEQLASPSPLPSH